MDTNPFANNQQQQTSVPDYLKQTNNPTYPGAVANMLKAIMQGNNEFKRRQALQGNQPLAPGSAIPGAVGPTSIGGPQGPMPLVGGGAAASPVPTPVSAPLPDATAAAAANPPVPMPTPRPDAASWGAGATQVGADPVTQALMSPIPGMSNTGVDPGLINMGFGGGPAWG